MYQQKKNLLFFSYTLNNLHLTMPSETGQNGNNKNVFKNGAEIN